MSWMYMKASLKISLIYIVVGTFWIVWSNNFIEYVLADYSRETIDLIKELDNILYVLLTGVLLFFLIKRQYKYMDDKVRELERGKQIIENERLKSDHSKKQLDQFIIVASHDLAGPVRQSQGFLELFIRKNQGKLSQNSIDFLQLTLDNFLKIKAIINDLSMFSQLSGLERKEERVSLDEVFEKVLHLNSKKIAEQKIGLKIAPLPSVKGDYKYFIQLFDHLIANAIKFKDVSRSLNIEVSAIVHDEFCTVEVRDNGRGIPIENLENVFYVLKRYDYGFIKRGTGMGLAICKRIAEGLGGQIWVESTIGKGSVFYVKLRV
ncbi:integral membrane sensor signal transduction histidine kinase [Cyclobacterium marinum DSM 745]|uniref:histidine kinase n=2 Tax=Cyclobacterium marinum TaxID=104 RepID=G0IUB9_CYCMS|nr:integral membrane sensor signal transduction histidine kinase [Cyclobacterium marinum DSM 745]